MAFAHAPGREPMCEMNTTPLIDVMLVLLIMFIMTIPVATHSVDIDLPQCKIDCGFPDAPDPIKNKVSIDAQDQLLWNGDHISEGQLVALLGAVQDMPVEPELQFEPDPLASYDRSARVLQVIRASGVTKFGFIGNEKYRQFGT
ncbi:MAG: biopolymer transporter ExbD [Sphingomonadaceae bacterium]|nr:biopolymer transporter ExbD [Sphingomonadaceae bacterium]